MIEFIIICDFQYLGERLFPDRCICQWDFSKLEFFSNASFVLKKKAELQRAILFWTVDYLGDWRNDDLIYYSIDTKQYQTKFIILSPYCSSKIMYLLRKRINLWSRPFPPCKLKIFKVFPGGTCNKEPYFIRSSFSFSCRKSGSLVLSIQRTLSMWLPTTANLLQFIWTPPTLILLSRK